MRGLRWEKLWFITFEVRNIDGIIAGAKMADGFIGKDIPIVHRVVRSYTEEDKKSKAKNKKAGCVMLSRAMFDYSPILINI